MEHKCENCGTEFDGKFCPNCGTSYSGSVACPHCGAEIAPSAKFCNNCGRSVVEKIGKSRPKHDLKTVVAKISVYLPWGALAFFAIMLWIACACPIMTISLFGFGESTSIFAALSANIDELTGVAIGFVVMAVLSTVVAAIGLLKRTAIGKNVKYQMATGAIYLATIVVAAIAASNVKNVGADTGAGTILAIVFACICLVVAAAGVFVRFKLKDVIAAEEAKKEKRVKVKKEHPALKKTAAFLNKHKKSIIAVSVVLVLVVTAICVVVPIATNIFRVAKVSKIKIGDSPERVQKVLGKPSNPNDNLKWTYYGGEYGKIQGKIDKLDAEITKLSMTTDFGMSNLDKIAKLENEKSALKAQQRNAPGKCIEIGFTQGKVSSVFFDTNANSATTQKEVAEWDAEIHTIDICEIEATKEKFILDDLSSKPFTIKYTDGSYAKKTIGTCTTEIKYMMVTVSWQDGLDEYSLNVRTNTRYSLDSDGKIRGNGSFTRNTVDGITYIDDFIVETADWNITDVELLPSSKIIWDNAFAYCICLTDIHLPDGLIYVGKDVFSSPSITVYCESPDKPDSWNDRWNSTGCTVVWNCNNNAAAEDGYIYTVVDGIRYALKDNVATVAPQYSTGETVVIPPSIIYNGKSYAVTSIGNKAFGYCQSLTSLTIPSSVTSISQSIFYDNYPLTIYCEASRHTSNWANSWNYDSHNHISYPVVWNYNFNDIATDGYSYTVIDEIRYALKDDTATVIKQPHNLHGAITIPQSVTHKGKSYTVTSIGDYAFMSCTSLTSITIPNSITRIGYEAFSNRYSLTIYCEASGKPSAWSNEWNYSSDGCYRPVVWNCMLNDIATDGCIYALIDGMYYALKDSAATVIRLVASSNNAVIIPKSVTYKGKSYTVTSIGDYAFMSCSSLKSISIPNAVTSIGDYAFYQCTKLESIVIPSGVTSIGERAFGVCYSLASITIPNSVTRIASGAFGGCFSLKSITIPSSVTFIGNFAFADCPVLKSATFEVTQGWSVSSYGSLPATSLTDPENAATNLKHFSNATWTRE